MANRFKLKKDNESYNEIFRASESFTQKSRSVDDTNYTTRNVLKDFDSYLKAQEKVNELYIDKERWQRMCGINIAHSGIFSSDRTIKEYATGIWGSTVIYKNL